MYNSNLFGCEMTLDVQYFGRQSWIVTKNEASRIRWLRFKSVLSLLLADSMPGESNLTLQYLSFRSEVKCGIL